jgi:uncharacterized protein (TIGR03382 family)
MRRLPLVALLWAAPALANVPASYLPCEGAADGDPCQLPGPLHGNCVRDTLCAPPDGGADRCLLCRDGCGALPAGETCLRRDGSHGVCVKQDPETCTDKPETSFDECNRCEEGAEAPTRPKDAGCAAADAAVVAPWAALLLVGAWQLRRRRAS